MSDERIDLRGREGRRRRPPKDEADPRRAASCGRSSAPRCPTLFDVQEMELNFGPQHPSTHGVLRLVLEGRRREDPRGEARTSATSTAAPRSSSRPRRTRWGSRTRTGWTTSRPPRTTTPSASTVEKLLGVEVPRRAQLHPRDPGRAAAALLASGLARDVRDRPRRGDALLVHVPRAGADPRLLRGVLRRAADAELHADRRPAVRPDAGLDRAAVASSSTTCPARIDDYEQLLTDNRIWKKRTVGIGVISGGGVHRVGPDRARSCAPPASSGTCAGRSPTSATTSSTSRSRRASERRHVRPLHRARPGDAAERADPPPVPREARAGGDPRQGPARHQAAGRGGLRLGRVAEGGARLLLRLQRHATSRTGCTCRPPSFINLQALPRLAKGHLVSDLVALIGTIDIVLGEVDR